MSIEARIEALEARRRGRGGRDGPLTMLRAKYDDAGHVIACEGQTVPLNPPNKDTLGPILAGMAVMVREANDRATCPYDDCDKRETCRADGSLTSGEWVNSPNS